jgi:hypothetical protein
VCHPSSNSSSPRSFPFKKILTSSFGNNGMFKGGKSQFHFHPRDFRKIAPQGRNLSIRPRVCLTSHGLPFRPTLQKGGKSGRRTEVNQVSPTGFIGVTDLVLDSIRSDVFVLSDELGKWF